MKKLVLFLLSTLALSSFAFAGDSEAGKSKSTSCYACHGEDGNGNSANPLWPKLAGQNETYLIKQMKDFKHGPKRVDATMNGMIMTISEGDFADVAAYYSSLDISRATVADKYLEAGKKLYRTGDADRRVTACTACHGPAGEGLASAGYPALSGQAPEYLAKQLKMFRDKSRSNDSNGIMQDVAKLMSDEQIESVAHYLVGLHR